MMRIIKYIILGILLLNLPFNCFAQFLETRQSISVNAGYGMLDGTEGNLFFPASVNQMGINVDLSYTHKVNRLLSGGFSLGINQFNNSTMDSELVEIQGDEIALITMGPQLILNSPYKSNGMFNFIKLGLAFVPQIHFYSGERKIFIDNEVRELNSGETISPTLDMEAKSSGFGLKICPEINFRITQRFGIKVAYAVQFLNVHSGYDNEKLIGNSVLGGLVFNFGNRKSLF